MKVSGEDRVLAATAAAYGLSVACGILLRAVRGGVEAGVPMDPDREFFLWTLANVAAVAPLLAYLASLRSGQMDDEFGKLEVDDPYKRILRATSWWLPGVLALDALRSVFFVSGYPLLALFCAALPETFAAWVVARRAQIHRKRGVWDVAPDPRSFDYLGRPSGDDSVYYVAGRGEIAHVHMPIAFYAAVASLRCWFQFAAFIASPSPASLEPGACPTTSAIVAFAAAGAVTAVVGGALSQATEPSASRAETATGFACMLALAAVDARMGALGCDPSSSWARWIVRASEGILACGTAYARAVAEASFDEELAVTTSPGA